MKNELDDKLKQIRIEDLIWVVYIGIIFLSWYDNYLEKKYYLYNDLESKKKYRTILIIIFTILLIVYAYFLKNSLDDYNNLNVYDNDKKRNLVTLSLLSSTLIFISGVIYLYIAYIDNELNVEIAFN